MSPNRSAAGVRALGAVLAIAALGSGALALAFEPRWPDPGAVILADIGTIAFGVSVLALVALSRLGRGASGPLAVIAESLSGLSALGVIGTMVAHLASGRVDDYTLVDIATIAAYLSGGLLVLAICLPRRWAVEVRVALVGAQVSLVLAVVVALLTTIYGGRLIATAGFALCYAAAGLVAVLRPEALHEAREHRGSRVATGAAAGLAVVVIAGGLVLPAASPASARPLDLVDEPVTTGLVGEAASDVVDADVPTGGVAAPAPALAGATAPEVQFTLSSRGVLYAEGLPLTLSYSCIDPAFEVILCEEQGGYVSGTPFAAVFDPATGGKMTWTVTARNSEGLARTVSYSIYVIESGATPRVDVLFDRPAHNGWFDGPVSATFIGMDTVGTVYESLYWQNTGVDWALLPMTNGLITVDWTEEGIFPWAYYAKGNGVMTATGGQVLRVDATAPTIEGIPEMFDGDGIPSFEVGETVELDYSCGDALSGVESCGGTVGSGGRLFTETPGRYQATIRATDAAGNATERVISWRVRGPQTDEPDPTDPIDPSGGADTPARPASGGAHVLASTGASDLWPGAVLVAVLLAASGLLLRRAARR